MLVQLMEKQKAKYSYGILEKQFRRLFEKAAASKGVTGEILLQLCEATIRQRSIQNGNRSI